VRWRHLAPFLFKSLRAVIPTAIVLQGVVRSRSILTEITLHWVTVGESCWPEIEHIAPSGRISSQESIAWGTGYLSGTWLSNTA